MTHHTTTFDLSRPHQQQQKPAPGSSKASTGKARWEQQEGLEIPRGYVVRNRHTVTAKPVRNIGPRDSEIVELAVRSFGYLLPLLTVDTLAGFASRIELACRDPKATVVANTLHRLSA